MQDVIETEAYPWSIVFHIYNSVIAWVPETSVEILS